MFGLLIAITGCSSHESMAEMIDRLSFSWWGTTLISSPNEVTLKEIHLDNGKLLGRTIVIQGTIVSTGKHYSHIVLTDDTARILTVLTSLTNAEEIMTSNSHEHMRVLGTVERGKKGLPFLLAKSLQPIPSDKFKKAQ